MKETKERTENKGKKVRLMFQDEAGFGRISTPAVCWCPAQVRPCVPSLRVREYIYLFGAAEPLTGESFFLILDKCDTISTNAFLKGLSEEFPEDIIVLVCDNASWHSSEDLQIPENIILTFIPPYTPEMNPIEQIWTEIRKMGFKNQFFDSLDDVIQKICEVIRKISPELISHITLRNWILSANL